METELASAMPAFRRRAERGFTLLEVMAAVAILGTVIVGLVAQQQAALDRANETKLRRIAWMLAEEKMAELELLDPEDISSESGTFENYEDFEWAATSELIEISSEEASAGSAEEEEEPRELYKIVLTIKTPGVAGEEDEPLQLVTYRLKPEDAGQQGE